MSDIKLLKKGDKAFIYFQGYEVRGIIDEVEVDVIFNHLSQRELKPEHHKLTMLVDDEHINENWEILDSINLFFTKNSWGEIYYKSWTNDFNLDIKRIREERLEKLLEK
ncbi:MAG: hypothetical protein SLAVMIC_00968 [uncultured marine phage]|uniref:Uncharacterized protein n=1 Tax=uncultured marine phage TaxID=707152 RepID=A0A8D9FRZ6_9VIRU|nr:MAG: hypothetical protein SLAVMIC_00968 [uncultured marine phage]